MWRPAPSVRGLVAATSIAAGVALSIVAAALGCRSSSPTQVLHPAGSSQDEGHGLLAHASTQLMTDPETAAPPLEPVSRRPHGEYGGNAYGGASYASYVVPAWPYPSTNRAPSYNQENGLASAIEGTITWSGRVPTLKTSCGTVRPLRVGSRHGLAGALVFLREVRVGRVLPHSGGEQRPASVGGTIVKRECALAPTLQIVTPVPAALSIHGDRTPARLRIVTSTVKSEPADLHPGGRISVQAGLGVTRVESIDGSIAAAWVVGLDTPAYAITDEDGRFRIDELAAGTYTIEVWQPPVPTVNAGALVYDEPKPVTRRVIVTGRMTRFDLALGR